MQFTSDPCRLNLLQTSPVSTLLTPRRVPCLYGNKPTASPRRLALPIQDVLPPVSSHLNHNHHGKLLSNPSSRIRPRSSQTGAPSPPVFTHTFKEHVPVSLFALKKPVTIPGVGDAEGDYCDGAGSSELRFIRIEGHKQESYNTPGQGRDRGFQNTSGSPGQRTISSAWWRGASR